jgi:uncharacterized protein YcbK (DUF882 family)
MKSGLKAAHDTGLSRRSFFILGAAVSVAAAVPSPVQAALRMFEDRTLTLYNTHTGEHLSEVYWSRGSYLPEGMHRVSKLLRDHRSGDTHPIDPAVLDLIAAVQHKCEVHGPIHIISGYRSPTTNAWLSAHSDGVACNSLHIQGKAIDIRLPGRTVRQVGRAAKSLRGGGVGIYPASDFVHVDSGRVRYW